MALYFTQLTINQGIKIYFELIMTFKLFSLQDGILHDNYVANFNYTSLQLTFINSSVNLWPCKLSNEFVILIVFSIM